VAVKQRDKARQKIADLNTKIETEQQNVKVAEDAADAAQQREQETPYRLKVLRAQSKQDKAGKKGPRKTPRRRGPRWPKRRPTCRSSRGA
jgi:hypothetical protein